MLFRALPCKQRKKKRRWAETSSTLMTRMRDDHESLLILLVDQAKSHQLLSKFNWTEVIFIKFTYLDAEEFATIRDHCLTAINKIMLCLPLWGCFSYNLFIIGTNSFIHVLDFVKSWIKAQFNTWSWEFLYTRICYKYFGAWLISCWRLLENKTGIGNLYQSSLQNWPKGKPW